MRDFIKEVIMIIKHWLELLQFWKNIEKEVGLDLAPDWAGEAPKRGLSKGRNYRMVRTSRGGINMPKR